MFSCSSPSLNPQPAAAATFTTNGGIKKTNFTYDAQDMVVSGATLTVDGPHASNSMLLRTPIPSPLGPLGS